MIDSYSAMEFYIKHWDFLEWLYEIGATSAGQTEHLRERLTEFDLPDDLRNEFEALCESEDWPLLLKIAFQDAYAEANRFLQCCVETLAKTVTTEAVLQKPKRERTIKHDWGIRRAVVPNGRGKRHSFLEFGLSFEAMKMRDGLEPPCLTSWLKLKHAKATEVRAHPRLKDVLPLPKKVAASIDEDEPQYVTLSAIELNGNDVREFKIDAEALIEQAMAPFKKLKAHHIEVLYALANGQETD